MRGDANILTTQRRRRRYFVAGVVVACSMISCVWFFVFNHSTIQAWATLPRPSEGRLPYPTAGSRYDPAIDVGTIEWDGNSISEALGKPVGGVQSGAFLVTVAHVSEGAEPVRGARVVFTLSSEAGSHSCIDRTNAQGAASCMRWIPDDARGRPMIVTAEATSNGWTRASSKWFVPE